MQTTKTTYTPFQQAMGAQHFHRTHYTKAMSFIAAHGHFAALTKDGLLALCEVFDTRAYYTDKAFGADKPDTTWQAPMVFQVDEAGMVSSREVREWLGY